MSGDAADNSYCHSRLLAPLAARYASWLGLPADATAEVPDEDPALVRAMPPGITVEHRDAQVRALVPWPVADTPRTVTRLQVGGTDVPPDDPGPPPDGVPVLWLTPQPAMTTGKAAAQVGHASMLLAALLVGHGRAAELDRWAADGYRCAVRTASAQQWADLAAGERPDRAWRARGVLAVRDAGFTEVAPGTVTCAAQWPARRS